MSDDLIQTYRNNVFTEFNSESRPWRLYTSNIYHDPSMITDDSYLPGTSAYNAYLNTLNIEASGANINFHTDDKHGTYFMNYVCAVEDASVNKNLAVGGNILASKFIGDGTSLTGVGSLALQEVKDCSFGYVEASNLEVLIDAEGVNDLR